MKKLIVLLSLVFSAQIAVSQLNQTEVVEQTTTVDSPIKGIFVGMEYMNITDVSMRYTVRSSDYLYYNSDTSKGGTQLGVTGISLGYKFEIDKGLLPARFTMGGRLLQSFNKNEYGTDKITFIVPEVNAGVLLGKYVELFGGVSIPVIRGSEQINKYESRGGLNAGLVISPNENIGIKLSSSVFMFHIEDKIDSSAFTADVLLSGFAAGLQYTF